MKGCQRLGERSLLGHSTVTSGKRQEVSSLEGPTPTETGANLSYIPPSWDASGSNLSPRCCPSRCRPHVSNDVGIYISCSGVISKPRLSLLQIFANQHSNASYAEPIWPLASFAASSRVCHAIQSNVPFSIVQLLANPPQVKSPA